MNRKDLTHLKVYAIDVDEADEVFGTTSFLDPNSISFYMWTFILKLRIICSLMMPWVQQDCKMAGLEYGYMLQIQLNMLNLGA